jgi:hypothetical protein
MNKLAVLALLTISSWVLCALIVWVISYAFQEVFR